ncbi:MAG: hypothetical protein MJ077_05300 [Oscillospiraceae bacterium]|nr:hypothetical protein [Oscillospiraceae bacterium]
MMNKQDAEAVIRDTIEYANHEIKKSKDQMRKRMLLCVAALVCIVVVLFFPFSKTVVFSGNGHVLNGEKEAIADCAIAIEVKEWRSLALRYKMSFSFAVDGTNCYVSDEVHFPLSFSVSERGDCLIGQSYYDEKTNSMKFCSLFYLGDYSLVETFWEDNYYSLSME